MRTSLRGFALTVRTNSKVKSIILIMIVMLTIIIIIIIMTIITIIIITIIIIISTFLAQAVACASIPGWDKFPG